MSSRTSRITYNYRPDVDWSESPEVPYVLDDVVSGNDGSYVYIHPRPSVAPTPSLTDTSYWLLIAPNGERGDIGQSFGNIVAPILTGVGSTAVTGNMYTLSANGSSMVGATAPIAYEWLIAGVAYHGATIQYTMPTTPGETLIIKVRGVDGVSNSRSNWTTKEVLLFNNSAPVVVNLQNDVPLVATAGSTVTVHFTGATDADGDQLTYTISDTAGITFAAPSNTTGTFAATIANTGMAFEFALTVTDTAGAATPAGTFTGTIRYPVDLAALVVTKPAVIARNSSGSITVAGAVDLNGGAVTYSIANATGVTITPASNTTGNFSAVYSNTATTYSFDLIATGSLGVVTPAGTYTGIINHAPDVSLMTTTLPAVVDNLGVYSVVFANVTDANNDTVTLSITSITGGTASKSSNIAIGEAVNITVTGSNAMLTVVVAAVDSRGTTSGTRTFTSAVNFAPAVTSMVSSLAAVVEPSAVFNFSVNGATDPNGDVLVYDITAISGGTVSKSLSIAANENVVITAGAAATSLSVTVRAKDVRGLYSPAKVFTAVINQAPVDTAVTTSVGAGNLQAAIAVTTSFTGATDPNGDAIVYDITSITGGTVSKSTGIASGESVTITPQSTGGTLSYTVKAKDSYGKLSAGKTFTNTIVNPLTTQTLAVNYPGNIVRGVVVSGLSFSGISDPNGGTITYQIQSVSGGTASVTNTSGPFTVDTVGNMTGLVITVKAVSSKGYETTVKTLTYAGTLTYATGTTTIPAGSTQTITIPEGIAGTVTVTGNGGGGSSDNSVDPGQRGDLGYFRVTRMSAEATNYLLQAYQGHIFNTAGIGYFTPPAWWLAESVTLNVRSSGTGYGTLYGTSLLYRFDNGHDLADGGFALASWPFTYIGPITSASPGASSTLTGDISKTFSGALSGVTTPPASTQEPFTLSPATAHSITATAAANGGSITIAW